MKLTPGQALKAARAAHRPPLTQGDVADKLGVSQPLVSRWENDEACVPTEMLRPAARIYGVRLDLLVPETAA